MSISKIIYFKRADKKANNSCFPFPIHFQKMHLVITTPSAWMWIMKHHSHTEASSTIFKLTTTLAIYKHYNYFYHVAQCCMLHSREGCLKTCDSITDCSTLSVTMAVVVNTELDKTHTEKRCKRYNTQHHSVLWSCWQCRHLQLYLMIYIKWLRCILHPVCYEQWPWVSGHCSLDLVMPHCE